LLFLIFLPTLISSRVVKSVSIFGLIGGFWLLYMGEISFVISITLATFFLLIFFLAFMPLIYFPLIARKALLIKQGRKVLALLLNVLLFFLNNTPVVVWTYINLEKMLRMYYANMSNGIPYLLYGYALAIGPLNRISKLINDATFYKVKYGAALLYIILATFNIWGLKAFYLIAGVKLIILFLYLIGCLFGDNLEKNLLNNYTLFLTVIVVLCQ